MDGLEVLHILYAHLDAISLIKEFQHSHIFQPLPLKLEQYIPKKSHQYIAPFAGYNTSTKELKRIGYRNWKDAEKTRKNSIKILKTYGLHSIEWMPFYQEKNINYKFFRLFIIKIQEKFSWHDPLFQLSDNSLKNISWDRNLSWMGIILQDYTRYKNILQKK